MIVQVFKFIKKAVVTSVEIGVGVVCVGYIWSECDYKNCKNGNNLCSLFSWA